VDRKFILLHNMSTLKQHCQKLLHERTLDLCLYSNKDVMKN